MLWNFYVFNIFYNCCLLSSCCRNFSNLTYISFGLYGGIFSWEGYNYNIEHGIINIWNTIRDGDKLSDSLIFGSNESCFPDCSDICKKKKEKKPKAKKKKNKNDSQNKEEYKPKNEETEIQEDNSPNNEESENKKILLSNQI